MMSKTEQNSGECTGNICPQYTSCIMSAYMVCSVQPVNPCMMRHQCHACTVKAMPTWACNSGRGMGSMCNHAAFQQDPQPLQPSCNGVTTHRHRVFDVGEAEGRQNWGTHVSFLLGLYRSACTFFLPKMASATKAQPYHSNGPCPSTR